MKALQKSYSIQSKFTQLCNLCLEGNKELLKLIMKKIIEGKYVLAQKTFIMTEIFLKELLLQLKVNLCIMLIQYFQIYLSKLRAVFILKYKLI